MKTFRSEKYKAWLRLQACVICNRQAGFVHHEPLGENYVGGKPPDTHGLPVCVECHNDRHQYGADWLEGFVDVKMAIIRLITCFLQGGGKF